MKKVFTLRRNNDGTVTFRSGRYVEHIDVSTKGLMETYDALKYAAICAEVPVSDDILEDLMREAKGLSHG